jgi:hypothetical protein
MAVALAQQPIQIDVAENGHDNGSAPDEVIVVCPKCKTLETLWLSAGFLVPTRKFRQYGRQVYHDCGSVEPCSLYHF